MNNYQAISHHVTSSKNGKILFRGTFTECETYVKRKKLCPYQIWAGSRLVEEVEWL